MNIHAIIHEQIDWDGIIKSFQLKEREEFGDLWVAFPGDYGDVRDGPFYFLDKEYETWFNTKKANCRQARIAPENFFQEGENYVFKTEWHKVPTLRDSLTYYALYLPESAVPTEIRFSDPYAKGKEYSRTVFRDDEKNRFVLYIECSSRFGTFSFDTFAKFHFDQDNFKNASYHDDKTVDFYKHLDPVEFFSSERDKETVSNFFIQTKQYNHNMGDTYHVNQAGAVGPGSSATNNTFNQQINSLPENTDYNALSDQLALLKDHLRDNAKNPDHWAAVAAIAAAEEGAKEKDGSKVLKSLSTAGKWIFDVAKDIGVDIAAEVIKKSIGI
jgi:hypothetical protein